VVGKYTQMWNYFNTSTSGEIVSTSTGYYNIPAVGGSLEVGKRFEFAGGCFFIEPQAQLAGVWEDGIDTRPVMDCECTVIRRPPYKAASVAG